MVAICVGQTFAAAVGHTLRAEKVSLHEYFISTVGMSTMRILLCKLNN